MAGAGREILAIGSVSLAERLVRDAAGDAERSTEKMERRGADVDTRMLAPSGDHVRVVMTSFSAVQTGMVARRCQFERKIAIVVEC